MICRKLLKIIFNKGFFLLGCVLINSLGYSKQITINYPEKKFFNYNEINTDTLEKLFQYYLNLDLDSSKLFLHALDAKCKAEKSRYVCAKYFLNKGIYYHRINNYDSALIYYHKARPILRDLKSYHGLMAVNNNLGALYEELKNYDSAANYLFNNLKLFDSIKDKSLDLELSKTLLNLGVFYQNQKEYLKAEKFYNQSYLIKQKYKDNKGLSLLYNNLALVKYFQNDIKTAENYFLNALRLNILTNDMRGLSRTYFNIGEIYLYEYKKVDKALYYYGKSYDIDLNLNDYAGQIDCLVKLSECFGMLKDFENAQKLLLKALGIAQMIKNSDLELQILQQLSEVYSTINDYKQVASILKKMVEIKDSLHELSSQIRLAAINEKYKNILDSVSQHVVKESYQKSQILKQGYYIFLVTMLLVIFAFIIFFIKYRNLTKTSNMLMIKNSILNYHIDKPLFISIEKQNILNTKPDYFQFESLLNMLEVANQAGKEHDFNKAKKSINILLENTVFPLFEQKFSLLTEKPSEKNKVIIRELKHALETQYIG